MVIVNKQSLLSIAGLQARPPDAKPLSEGVDALYNANSFNHTKQAAAEAAEHSTVETTKCFRPLENS